MNNQVNFTDRTIREPECRQITGLCRTTRYLMEREGKFPARRKLGGRAIGWMLSEIQVWQQNQPRVTTDKACEVVHAR
ncbi:TPA: AlpA family phage regulatory protein [Yersinia enterocolitica]|uniref:helix-turn-helix transcriptional regulator n=1 Tax=Yersinia enterocolitica TaxID=630 RepID=UPI0028B90988|nr:AlpA family phage regulatory protein [Yersinia enterocolitica]HEN3433409.1 AlpA family phage regulatory protein [Yersinia enterocolitica]HEN3584324.1 AlpA family phage regulatory protein [Yersinia enterocolitica]